MSQTPAPPPPMARPMTARLAWAIYADALDLLVRAALAAALVAAIVTLGMLFLDSSDDDGSAALLGLGAGGAAFLAAVGLRSHKITRALMKGGTPPFYVSE